MSETDTRPAKPSRWATMGQPIKPPDARTPDAMELEARNLRERYCRLEIGTDEYRSRLSAIHADLQAARGYGRCSCTNCRVAS